MKYIDEFRNSKLVGLWARKIAEITPEDQTVNLMEVCGTHTMSFFRFGLKSLLPPKIRLVSGPGCPVCVSTQEYIDKAVAFTKDSSNIVVSFGDMLKVIGSVSSLEKERSRGSDIRVVYSPLESLEIARGHPGKNIVFLGVGFETTAPAIALSLLHAEKERLKNFFILTSLKIMPPAMQALAGDRRLNIQGFICPGHVSAIIGLSGYEAIARRYKMSCVVAGFEPIDLLEAVYLLLKQKKEGRFGVENQYRRVVKRQGNRQALKIISRVFKVVDTEWRGLGIIKKSGLAIKERYRRFDAAENLAPSDYKPKGAPRSSGVCRCSEVLKGIIVPSECPLFGLKCNPNYPLGPCMVSLEGACNVYYRYER